MNRVPVTVNHSRLVSRLVKPEFTERATRYFVAPATGRQERSGVSSTVAPFAGAIF